MHVQLCMRTHACAPMHVYLRVRIDVGDGDGRLERRGPELVAEGEEAAQRPRVRRLCGIQPLVWVVLTKLENSLARSNRSRFG